MNNRLIQIQIFSEIAMGIGHELNLREMLGASLPVYLRKLNCLAGIVLQSQLGPDSMTSFRVAAQIPSKAKPSPALAAALALLPKASGPASLEAFYETLPIIAAVDGGKHCYVMPLPDFGLLVLIKAGQPFEGAVVKSLHSLNVWLAKSCIHCVQREELSAVNVKLRREIEERGHAEERLREVLEELETRVLARTNDLLKANQRLEEALANVKTLRGMLPICSVCKKVRDDTGYWRQIESYIAHHSGALFTHGICPDCTKKIYPDIDLPPDL